VINRSIMIMIIVDLYFPGTVFCPKDTDFKRAFGHTCTCLMDTFTSLDIAFRAPQVAAPYCRRLTLIRFLCVRAYIALEACMAANDALRTFERGTNTLLPLGVREPYLCSCKWLARKVRFVIYV